MVIIDASQALDPGSIPGRRSGPFNFCFSLSSPVRFYLKIPPSAWTHGPWIQPMFAHVAQLGERQTEDLKVLGSIPSVGSVALVAQFGRAWV